MLHIHTNMKEQPPIGNESDLDLFFLKENPRLFERAVINFHKLITELIALFLPTKNKFSRAHLYLFVV